MIFFNNAKKKEFISLVDMARDRVTDPACLADKWLRNSTDLYQWYKKEYRAFSPRKGSSILDLGAGPGFLLWFAREYGGCSVAGIEKLTREDFTILWDILSLTTNMKTERIEAMKHIQIDGSFDYISATGINFTRPSRKEWTLAEHVFFLKDMASHLNENGELYLRFNARPPEEVARFFEKYAYWQNVDAFKIKKSSIEEMPQA